MGRQAELFTYGELAKYTRKHTPCAGYDCLSNAAKATIWRILDAHPIQPHKIKFSKEKNQTAVLTEDKSNRLLMHNPFFTFVIHRAAMDCFF